ncbi:uncharacterized protein L3040_007951 [Drepanopeziza brunnea f. sp. 'multigermtubi']|uniref:Opioid growth factor receptor (OGFr) region n=1 Tax=Marssonina brunnea f. sp. multigermtubi (strain MB_m1) TaxID=1072389 RepID=K1W9W2_MARBU|nr:Opioid growth factor receptor (OGFr) region [Drepanopeziza brunnea f. sp. 'multigermtubi' MB_m1]EKD14045.1 Opioid growth factor receptor (OGFr) region [Drepanopeziza brunnea f. sp. 'multigermtubi' MB_m1]KAJ5035484.1 hypothetical protein L3040_007951 [Drepanopeziza brunnea f. sp. 'multigermtubi']
MNLIAFYEEKGTDLLGRSLLRILQWNEERLEKCHNYIQFLFPLPEMSNVNVNAPIIDRRVFDEFRLRPDLRRNLKMSFKKMLWFYGFRLETEGERIKVCRGENFDQQSRIWDCRFDHNHLRITRIIRCLRVLGLEEEALAFRATLESSTINVSARSREFWRRAAKRSLNLRPDFEEDDIDGEDDLTVGPAFLREFEQRRKEQAQSDANAARIKKEVENSEAQSNANSVRIKEEPEDF